MQRTISDTEWLDILNIIELHLKADSNITDVCLNFQLRVPKRGTANTLRLNR
jgi:hypothetical protein